MGGIYYLWSTALAPEMGVIEVGEVREDLDEDLVGREETIYMAGVIVHGERLKKSERSCRQWPEPKSTKSRAGSCRLVARAGRMPQPDSHWLPL